MKSREMKNQGPKTVVQPVNKMLDAKSHSSKNC